MVSDRGDQFTGGLWERVCKLCNVQRKLSAAYHPQTDDRTERVNSVVETYLRIYTYYDQSDWSSLLPIAEFALNCRTASSTGLSPFFLAYGYQPSPFKLTEDESRLSFERNKSSRKAGEAIARTVKESLD